MSNIGNDALRCKSEFVSMGQVVLQKSSIKASGLKHTKFC